MRKATWSNLKAIKLNKRKSCLKAEKEPTWAQESMWGMVQKKNSTPFMEANGTIRLLSTSVFEKNFFLVMIFVNLFVAPQNPLQGHYDHFTPQTQRLKVKTI